MTQSLVAEQAGRAGPTKSHQGIRSHNWRYIYCPSFPERRPNFLQGPQHVMVTGFLTAYSLPNTRRWVVFERPDPS